MSSLWEPSGDLEIEAVPPRPARAGHDAGTIGSVVEAARRAALALRVVAGVISASSVIGAALFTFWQDDGGFSGGGESTRQQVANFLAFIGTPLALAALVVAASYLVTLYAARVELEMTTVDAVPVTRFETDRSVWQRRPNQR